MMEQYKKLDKNKLLLSPSGGKQQTRAENTGGVRDSCDFDGHDYQKQHNSSAQFGQRNKASADQSIRSMTQMTNESMQGMPKAAPSPMRQPRQPPLSTEQSEQAQLLIQQNPQLKQQAEASHTKGYQARKQGDYNLAIQYYTQALEIYPYHFKALFNRGFAFDKLGQFEQAIEDYSQAILVEP